jgi:hypothetical protein
VSTLPNLSPSFSSSSSSYPPPQVLYLHSLQSVCNLKIASRGNVVVAGAVAAGSRSRAAANSKDALEGDITRLETALSDALAIKGQRGTIEISAEPHARNAAMSRIHAKHASEHGREVQWGRAPIPEADGSSSEDAHLIDQDSQRRRRSAMMMVTPEERQSQRETEEVMMGHGAEEKDPSLAISEPVLDGAADDVAAVSPSSLSMGGPREGGRGGSEMRLARAQRAKGDGIRSEVKHQTLGHGPVKTVSCLGPKHQDCAVCLTRMNPAF